MSTTKMNGKSNGHVVPKPKGPKRKEPLDTEPFTRFDHMGAMVPKQKPAAPKQKLPAPPAENDLVGGDLLTLMELQKLEARPPLDLGYSDEIPNIDRVRQLLEEVELVRQDGKALTPAAQELLRLAQKIYDRYFAAAEEKKNEERVERRRKEALRQPLQRAAQPPDDGEEAPLPPGVTRQTEVVDPRLRRVWQHHHQALIALGHAPEEAADRADEECEKLVQQLDSWHAAANKISAADLLARPMHQPYLVHGVLARYQPLTIGGPQKTLKTSTAFDLAVSLVTGTPFLGHAVPQAVRVGLMSAESGLSTVQDILERVLIAKNNLPRKRLGDRLWVWERVPSLADLLAPLIIKDAIEQCQLDVIILDPAYLLLAGADTQKLTEMGPRLQQIREICEELKCTPILLHHATKSSGASQKPLELTDLSGAGFAEWARQWLLLSRRRPYSPGSGMHYLWASWGGSAGHSGLLGLDVDETVDHTLTLDRRVRAEQHGLPPPSEPARRWQVTWRDPGLTRAVDQQAAAKAEAAAADNEGLLPTHTARLLAAAQRLVEPASKTELRRAAKLNPPNGNAAIAAALASGDLKELPQEPGKRNPRYIAAAVADALEHPAEAGQSQ